MCIYFCVYECTYIYTHTHTSAHTKSFSVTSTQCQSHSNVGTELFMGLHFTDLNWDLGSLVLTVFLSYGLCLQLKFHHFPCCIWTIIEDVFHRQNFPWTQMLILWFLTNCTSLYAWGGGRVSAPILFYKACVSYSFAFYLFMLSIISPGYWGIGLHSGF